MSIDYLDLPDHPIIPRRICESCGSEMTQDEFEMFENECEECVLQSTGGLLDDEVYKELKFDDGC